MEGQELTSDIRQCNKCSEYKYLTDYYVRKDSKDGYAKTCKTCKNFLDRLRYKQNKENIFSEVEISTDLSLPELKALVKTHRIVLKGHCNKQDIVDVLKENQVLPLDYTLSKRRVKNAAPLARAAPHTSCASQINAKTNIVAKQPKVPRKVQLTLAEQDGTLTDTGGPTSSTVHQFPSIYKAAKFLGVYSCVVATNDMLYYKSKIDGKNYKINLLDK